MLSGCRRELIASVLATGGEGIAECVEGIRVEVRVKVLKMFLVCSGFFRFSAQSLVESVVRLRCWRRCQVLEADLLVYGCDRRNKKPLWWQGALGD